MASIKRENIGLLNDKLTVNLTPTDYLGGFEAILKKHAKTANIPGFRKGMVPASMIKKMYGQSVFTDEVLKKVEAELNQYLSAEKIEIFAQPLPLDSQLANMDFNNPGTYDFAFEIGLKPNFEIKTKDIKVKRYKVAVTDEMIQNEVDRIQTRNGKMTEPETADSEENVLNVTFIESDKDGNEVEAVLQLTKGFGAEAVIDFVGEKGSIKKGLAMTRALGNYYIVGYGEDIQISALDLITTERNIVGNLVGTWADLNELMSLAERGLVHLSTVEYALRDADQALHDLNAGKVKGRAILVP